MTARLRLGAALLLATALVAGCASEPPAGKHVSEVGVISGPSGVATAAAGTPGPVRWWSNGTDPVGSPIGSTSPTLHPSRTVYCGMLRAAVRSGHGVIGPSADGGTATEFLTELAAVAPEPVTTAWRTVAARLAAAVTATASSATTSSATTSSATTSSATTDPSAVRAAAARIATDARTACGVTLSRGGG